MKNIITIQHTQSLQHTNGMIGSWRDWDLTDLGIKQAERIGERLSKEIHNKQYIMYSSDLLRARHTAQIIAGYLGIEPSYSDALREMNLGEAIGKSKEWARQNIKCPVWSDTVDWPNNIDDKPFTGSESKKDVWNRLLGFYDQVLRNESNNMLIVSHGGTLSIFYSLWISKDIHILDKHNFSGISGGVSFLSEDDNHNHIISRLNDLSYIQ